MCALPLKDYDKKIYKIIEASGEIFKDKNSPRIKIDFKIEFDTLYPEKIDGKISVLDKEEFDNEKLSELIDDNSFWIFYKTHWGQEAIFIKPNYAVNMVLDQVVEISIKEIYLISREDIKGTQKHNYLDFESTEQHGVTTHFMKPFRLQGRFFEPTLHFRRGILINYDYEFRKSFDEGGWSDIDWLIKLDSNVFVNPTMNFLEQEYFDTEAYTALPEISFQSKIDSSLNEEISDEDLISLFQKKYIDQEIIEKSISFTTGKRIYSHFSILSYYWPPKKYLTVKRYKSTVNRKTLHISRTNLYNGGWELIRDLSQKIYSSKEAVVKRVKRSIDRYVESFEAPYLEVKLVLLHSALSILLDQKRYTKMNFEKEDGLANIPIKPLENAGALPKAIVAFMLHNKINWSDLSKDPENENLNDFNELRNQYLKQLDHEIKDIKPINTLCVLYERILLYELNLVHSDYPVLE